MNRQDLLRIQINCVRDKLHTLIASNRTLSSPEVVNLSQLLDDLLNKHDEANR